MYVVVFIAVFGSSVVGATLFGISLNKMALLPLEIFLILENGKNTKFCIHGRQKYLVWWYVISCGGSLSGIAFSIIHNTQVTDELIRRAGFQVFSYIFLLGPIALMIWNSQYQYKYIFCFKKAFIWTARIQAMWGIMQFLLMQTIRFDLNGIVLEKMFEGTWTQYSNIANSSVGVVMRVTGINHDAAFLGLLLLIGFILESKPLYKTLYVVCALFALSRVALVSIVLVVFYQLVINIKRNKLNYGKLKSLVKYGVIGIIIFIIFFKIYTEAPAVQKQIIRVIERFSTISTGADGTSRHSGYPIAMLQLELQHIPLIQKLIGVGNQCGGILMSYYSEYLQWLGLSTSMLKLDYVWSVESDIASVFLETGIIGGFLYYIFLCKSFFSARTDERKRTLVIGIVIFGIMYNMAGGAFIQLVYISLLATNYSLNNNLDCYGVHEKNEFEKKYLYRVGQLL